MLNYWREAKDTQGIPALVASLNAGTPLLKATAQRLAQALAQGFALAETPPNPELTHRLTEDVWVFSGFKTYEQLRRASELLLDSERQVRPWTKFKNDVLALHPKYNQSYLEAEYHHAVGASQLAAKWQKYEAEKDLFQLRYRATIDERTRTSHRGMHGITLPVDDPFWDSYLPPNGWRCRCGVLQVPADLPSSDPETAQTEGEKATTLIGKDGENKLAIFRYNAGKHKAVFPTHHPYYDVAKASKHRITGHALRQGAGGSGSLGTRWIKAEDIKIQGHSLAEKLKSVESQIYDGINEVAFVFSPQGRLIRAITGTEDGVPISPQKAGEYKGCILTHNHPNGKVLSFDDIVSAVKHGIAQIRAVAGEYVFVLDVPQGIDVNNLKDLVIDLLDLAEERDMTPIENYEYEKHFISFDVAKSIGATIEKHKV